MPFHFCIKTDENLITNLSKNNIGFKVGFGIVVLIIFHAFQFDFGPLWPPKWAAFCC